MQWLALIFGGALGTAARFSLSSWTQTQVSGRIYSGTLAVNLLGCFLIGFFYVIGYQRQALSQTALAFLVIGFCGAFTTFSTYVLEFHKLSEQGQHAEAFFYGLVSLICGYAFFHAGLWAGRLASHG